MYYHEETKDSTIKDVHTGTFMLIDTREREREREAISESGKGEKLLSPFLHP
jgi:sugar (pentulose or hexulose) kinase